MYNLSYQILSMIAPLVTTPYISRILGAELIGRNSYASAIATYFSLFAAMGTTIYGQREISYFQDEKKKRSIKFWNIKILTCISVILMLFIYNIYILFLSRDKILAAIFGVTILTVLVDVTWFFQGMEQFDRIATRNIIIKIAQLLFIFLFIKDRNDFYLYVIGNVGFSLLSAVLLWIYIPKYIKKIPKTEIRPLGELLPVWSLFIPTIAVSIYTLLDKTMIGICSDSTIQNGYYEQSLTVIRFLQSFVTSLGVVMIPRIGNCFEKSDYESVKKYMYKSYNFVWMIGIPLCLGVIATAPVFVPWFFGENFLEVVPLVRILSLLLLAIGVNNVTGNQYLIPTKRQKMYTKSVVIGAIVNFILNLCLIPKYKAFGAACASVVAESVIAIIQIYWVRTELCIKNIVNISWKYIISGIVMTCVVIGTERSMDATATNLVILVLVGSIVYLVVLGLLKEKMLFGYLKQVCRKMLRMLKKEENC